MSSPEEEEEVEPPSAQPRGSLFESSDDVSMGSEYSLEDAASESPREPVGGGLIRASSDPPDPYRPNKYHGNPNTWRNLTAADRDVATSLEQLQARDLSIHLFNAYSLNVNGRHLGSARLPIPDWRPPKSWTAWPMKAEQVPREVSEIWANLKGEGETIRSLRSHGGSRQSLEEIMIAAITKKARERFKERSLGDNSGANEAGMSHIGKKDSAKSLRSLQGNFVASCSSRRSSHTQIEDESDERVKGQQSNGDASSLSPVPLMDDDYAASIVQSSVRHILSRLDTLLMGLHLARQALIRASHDSPSHSEPSGDLSRSASRSRRHGQNKTRRAPSSDSKSSISNSIDSPAEDSEVDKVRLRKRGHVSSTDAPNKNPYRQASRPDRIGQRDWSDVLGIAGMQGWPPEVIEKVAARCSLLFNERIDLTSIELGADTMRTSVHREMTTSSEDELEGGVHVDGFLRTIKRRKGWRGKNKEKGNWKSRKKEEDERKGKLEGDAEGE